MSVTNLHSGLTLVGTVLSPAAGALGPQSRFRLEQIFNGIADSGCQIRGPFSRYPCDNQVGPRSTGTVPSIATIRQAYVLSVPAPSAHSAI